MPLKVIRKEFGDSLAFYGGEVIAWKIDIRPEVKFDHFYPYIDPGAVEKIANSMPISFYTRPRHRDDPYNGIHPEFPGIWPSGLSESSGSKLPVPSWWSDNYVYSSVPFPGSQQVTQGLKYLEVINSSNTSGWPGLKGAQGALLALTKSKLNITRPKKPRYLKPKLVKLHRPRLPARTKIPDTAPSQRLDESLVAFERRTASWLVRVQTRASRRDAINLLVYDRQFKRYRDNLLSNRLRLRNADDAHKKALEAYTEKLAEYNRAVLESKTRRYSRDKVSAPLLLQDNPYGRIKAAFRFAHVAKASGFGTMYSTDLLGPMLNNLGRYDEFVEHTFRYYAVYRTKTSGQGTEFTDLAGYGETVRTLVLANALPHLGALDSRVRRKILQKLRNQVVHIGNIVAERKQTFDLLQSSVKRILDLIKAKRSIFKTASGYISNPKKIADDVLAFQFGVKPLISDIQSFAKYLDEGKDEPIVVARSNLGKSGVLINISTPTFSFSGRVEISYTIKCVVSNPASRLLSTFGLINPLEILWEVTPWSFVVDWFLPVGDWLASKTADCGLEFKTGTRKVRLIGNFSPDSSPEGNSDVDYSNHSFVPFTGEVVDRSVLTDFPSLPPVAVKNPLSWSHGVSSVALAVQRLKISP